MLLNSILTIVQIIVAVFILLLLVLLLKQDDEKFTEIENIPKTITKEAIIYQHEYFYDNKYHPEYRYIITAINELNGAKKMREFNARGLPILPDMIISDEIVFMTNTFVKKVNSIMKNPKKGVRKWDDLTPEIKLESGFERSQRHLGLAATIFNTDIINSPIELVKIDSCEKLETENEIQIKIKIVLGKTINPKIDQISLNVTFRKIKNDISEDTFFRNQLDPKFIISEVFVFGFYSTKIPNITSYDKDNEKYDMKEAKEDNRDPRVDITPMQKEVDFIEKEYKKRSEENNYQVSMLDDEGKAFNSSLRYLENDQYKKKYNTNEERVWI